MGRRAAAAVVIAVLLLVAPALAGCAAKSDHAAKPTRLPDVTLPGVGGGKAVDLGSLKGPAVVNVWASWCGPCKEELPRYQAFATAHRGRIRVLGIDFQETKPGAAAALMRTSGVTYPVVADHDGKLRAHILPELILVDARGRIVFSQYVQIHSVAQLDKLVAAHLSSAA